MALTMQDSRTENTLYLSSGLLRFFRFRLFRHLAVHPFHGFEHDLIVQEMLIDACGGMRYRL